SYASPGTFTVRLVANFGACQDSSSRSIVVRPKPVVDFTISGNTASCTPPVVVQFTSNAPTAVAYKWYFGDGDSSTQRNPSHTYSALGNYTVTLVVTDARGCTATAIK